MWLWWGGGCSPKGIPTSPTPTPPQQWSNEHSWWVSSRWPLTMSSVSAAAAASQRDVCCPPSGSDTPPSACGTPPSAGPRHLTEPRRRYLKVHMLVYRFNISHMLTLLLHMLYCLPKTTVFFFNSALLQDFLCHLPSKKTFSVLPCLFKRPSQKTQFALSCQKMWRRARQLLTCCFKAWQASHKAGFMQICQNKWKTNEPFETTEALLSIGKPKTY